MTAQPTGDLTPIYQEIRDQHEADIAEFEQKAERAHADGNDSQESWYRGMAAKLRAIPYPWEHTEAA